MLLWSGSLKVRQASLCNPIYSYYGLRDLCSAVKHKHTGDNSEQSQESEEGTWSKLRIGDEPKLRPTQIGVTNTNLTLCPPMQSPLAGQHCNKGSKEPGLPKMQLKVKCPILHPSSLHFLPPWLELFTATSSIPHLRLYPHPHSKHIHSSLFSLSPHQA